MGLMILTLAVLGETITCSICYDRAHDSSIHRGTYHILESTTRSASLPMALVSPPHFDLLEKRFFLFSICLLFYFSI